MSANELIELLKRDMSVSYQTFAKALKAAKEVSKKYGLEIFILIDKEEFIISSSQSKKDTHTSEEVDWAIECIYGLQNEADIYPTEPPRDKPHLSEKELEEKEQRDAADWSDVFDDFDADDWEDHYDREYDH